MHYGKLKMGVVDDSKYRKERIKILWILREPNGENFDFKNFLKDPRVYSRWKSSYGLVVKTSNALLNNHTNPFLYPKDIPEIMSRIALINVKKTGGKAKIDDKKIREYLLQNPDELQNQIKELSPDIIILAGTGGYISEERIKEKAGKNTIIVKAFHPNQKKIKHGDYISNILKAVDKAS